MHIRIRRRFAGGVIDGYRTRCQLVDPWNACWCTAGMRKTPAWDEPYTLSRSCGKPSPQGGSALIYSLQIYIYIYLDQHLNTLEVRQVSTVFTVFTVLLICFERSCR